MSRKEQIRKTFDTVAEGYDSDSLWFFQASTVGVLNRLSLMGHERVLDAATGTGIAALALAGALARGHVTAIDMSPGMLSVARRKAAARGVSNIEFIEMDFDAPTLREQSFDIANCSFGIFFVEDMTQGLRAIANLVKPGGRVITTCFGANSFSPHSDIFLDRLERYGFERPPLSSKRTDTEDKCRTLFESAGLHDVITHTADLSREVRSVDTWWDIVWNAGYRGLINQIGAERIPQFKREHLEEISELTLSRGNIMNVEVIYTVGTVP